MSAHGSKKVIYAALVGNGLIAITKFGAAAVTGSSAMLSEGIHSVVDTGNQILLLHALRRARRPADERFPYGHGKEVYFWSFVVAILIFAVGAGLSMYEGIHHLLHPRTVENVLVSYVVLGFSMLFEGAAWLFAYREFSRLRGRRSLLQAVQGSKDPSVFVVLFEDSAAMAGLLVAFLGILLGQLTGSPLFDGLASVVIGLILGGTAIWLAWETKGLLIGESARPEVVEGIRRLADPCPEIERVKEVLTLHMGPEYILVNLSLDLKDSIPAGQIERALAGLSRQIQEAFPRVQKVFIAGEAWNRRGPASSEPPSPSSKSRATD